MICCNLMTIACFAVIVYFSHLLSFYALHGLYFAIGFFVSSILLAFSLTQRLMPERAHGISFALLNMVISLCGAIFQPLIGALFYWLNNGSHSVTHPAVFKESFIYLLIPLLISLVCCIAIRERAVD